MLTITCPECGINSSISLKQPVYEGPYRCWRCRQALLVQIENDELKLCTPISEEDFQNWEEPQGE